MNTTRQKRAPAPVCTSPGQLTLDCFQTPFDPSLFVEFRKRFGCYPRELLADQIFCTRANRAWLKERRIKLKANPLERLPAVLNHGCPVERNLVEGKFGQATTTNGLNRIRARLQNTSVSWIASIILVLNLVRSAGLALHCLIEGWYERFFSKTEGGAGQRFSAGYLAWSYSHLRIIELLSN